MAETLKEYLVRLGYKVDESSEHRFNDSIDKLVPRILSLGKAATGMAVALTGALDLAASKMQELWVASHKTGAPASQLAAAGVAARKTGLDIRNVIGEMNEFLRSTPQGANFLEKMFGVKPEHLGKDQFGFATMTNEALEDFAKGIEDIQKKYPGARGYAIISSLLANLGVGESPYQILSTLKEAATDAEKAGAANRKMGADIDKATEAGHGLYEQLQDIKNALWVAFDVQPIQQFGEQLHATLQQAIADMQQMVAVNAEAKSIPSTLLDIIGLGGIGTFVLNRLLKLGKAAAPAAAGGAAAAAEGGAAAAGGAGAATGAAALTDAEILGAMTPLAGVGAFLYGMRPKPANEGEATDLAHALAGRYQSYNQLSPFQQGVFQHAVDFFEKHFGWSQQKAVAFVSSTALAESGMNPNAMGDHGTSFGLFQFHKERLDRLKRNFGDKANTVDAQLAEAALELETTHRNVLEKINSAKSTAEVVQTAVKDFENPKDKEGAIAKREALATVMNNTFNTNVTITGAKDAKDTAAKVGTVLGKVQAGHVNTLAKLGTPGVR